jgi:hypothetical protein
LYQKGIRNRKEIKNEAITKRATNLKIGLRVGFARNFDKPPITQVIRTPIIEQVIEINGIKTIVSQVTYCWVNVPKDIMPVVVI